MEPGKSRQSKDLTDVTVLSTPLPQASSTVDRTRPKMRRSQCDDNSKHRQLNFDQSNATNNTERSSLGIIHNISALLNDDILDDLKINGNCPEREREYARKLLRKCDLGSETFSCPDKENNANSSNLMKTYNVNNAKSNSRSTTSTRSLAKDSKQPSESDYKSTGTASINFEPTEMSARSSVLNKTPEKTEPFPQQSFSGISYDSNLAELMGQYGEEEFVSGSKAGSQMFADELSWRKNQLSSVPMNNNKNEESRLDYSYFSGIVGGDFTVDGGRLSAGEFFRHNGDKVSHISTISTSDRISLGLDTRSPQKQRRPRALVDQTVTTEASYPDEKESISADCTKDPSVMSLSSIAQIIQTIDSATPRTLVDKILDINKKKKRHREDDRKTVGNTYTLLPANRTSLPASSSSYISNEKPEKDTTQRNVGNKLSLDSKSINKMDNNNFNEFLSGSNFFDPNSLKLPGMSTDEFLEESSQENEYQNSDQLSLQPDQQKSPSTSIPRAEQSLMPPPRQSYLSNIHHKYADSFPQIHNESSLLRDTVLLEKSDSNMTRIDSTLKEETFANSSPRKQSFETRKLEVGKKTQELCTCLVNIPKEADFELHNGTDRWIICSLKLNQIQGEKDNIQFDLPNEDILVEPDAQKSFKIGVNMPRLGKLTIADFNILCSDMVTRSCWNMKHLMCFVPEEPNIRVLLPSGETTVDFQTITEDTSNSSSLTFENGNSIDVPILIKLNQENPQLFSFSDFLDDTVNSVYNQKESIRFLLKPKQPIKLNIDFKGMSLQSFGEKALRKGVYNVEAKLTVFICFKENEEYLVKEIPLVGTVGSCKLDILDTQFPLSLRPRIGRVISLKNSGSIGVSATVDIVQSIENQSECRDFFICPNNIVLNRGEKVALQISYKPENKKTDVERQAMIKITEKNKVSFYPIIGERGLEPEQVSSDSTQFQRSETPQRLRSISSPTSPHSLVFNRSQNSGRNSPISTASGGTVTDSTVPIRATHTALVWGSVKIGKSDTKPLTIRNTSNNKIKLIVFIKVGGQCFKILKDRHITATTMTLVLQGMESRTLNIIFAPNSAKAAVGRIMFSHYHSVREGHQLSGLAKAVQLYGYGGYGRVEISEALKDTSGQMWLSLGKLNSEGILNGKIRLHNTGELSCFAKVKLVPKALYPSMISNWHVEPTEIILAPNEIQYISLEFRPRRDDITAHQIGVSHVGTLKITHGDEPTRLRIRRLYKKLKDSGQLYDKIDEHADEFRDVIHQISRAITGEVFTNDLKSIGDSVNNIGDLCRGIVQNDIKLTVEIPADETISMLQDNMDESQTFYSLYSDHDESHFGDSFLPAD